MDEPRPWDAVLLAAGRSSRMGFPKALVRRRSWGEATALARLAAMARRAGAKEVITVVGHGSERIREESGADVRWVVNPEPTRGQTSSIRLGVDAVGQGRGCALTPVDHAWVTGVTWTALAEQFARSSAEIVVPRHRGRRGHPAFFASAVIDEFLQLDDGEPGHRVVRRDAGRVVEIDVDDEGIWRDFDRPSDLEGGEEVR